MNMNLVIEPADNAFVPIPNRRLLADEFPFAAVPIAVHMRHFGIRSGLAVSIAVHALFDLARILADGLAAVRALHLDTLLTTRRRSKPLPFSVALVIAAGSACILMGVFNNEWLAADGASKGYIAALKVAVVLAAVLVIVQVSALLARVLGAGDDLPAATSAVDNFGAGIFDFLGHLASPVCFCFRTLYHD